MGLLLPGATKHKEERKKRPIIKQIGKNNDSRLGLSSARPIILFGSSFFFNFKDAFSYKTVIHKHPLLTFMLSALLVTMLSPPASQTQGDARSWVYMYKSS